MSSPHANSPLIIRTRDNGVLDNTTLGDIKAIAGQVLAADRAVLHVHGGLVSAEHGLAAARRLDPIYRGAGLLPVYPVWETGALETIRNHADSIFNERLFRVLLKFVLKYAGGKLTQSPGQRATETYLPLKDLDVEKAIEQAEAARANPALPEPLSPLLETLRSTPPPPTALTQTESESFRNDLEQSQELQDAVDGVMLELVPRPPGGRAPSADVVPTPTLLSPKIQDELRREVKPGARGLFSVAAIVRYGVLILVRVIKRFVQHRDHGLWTTCVEEICRQLYLDAAGGAVWGFMKRDAEETFKQGSPPAPRGGSAFLDALGEGLRGRDAGQTVPRLSIVAHSAGCIWASHFLFALKARLDSGALPVGFRLDRLIFLAAAGTDELFKEVLLRQDSTPLFRDFRLFAMDDELEGGYWEAPPLYPRSLLYMVSGMFEPSADTPLVGMQRYFTRKADYDIPYVDRVRSFLSQPTFAVWAIAEGGPGLSCDSTRHGDFTDTGPPLPSTMRSVLDFLKSETLL